MFTQSDVVAGIFRWFSATNASVTSAQMREGWRPPGEVPRIEFGDGRVEFVRVEYDPRDDSVFGVDLDEAEHLAVERVGPLLRPKKRVRP